MNKKRIIIISLAVFVSCIIYYLYFTKPVQFLNEQQILDEMNASNDRIKVEKIEGIIKLDEEHYFVPFVRENGQLGMSYYRWSRAKWRLISFGYNKFAEVWQLDKNAPETKYIVWHYPPDEVDYMKLYLMNDRYYSISGDDSYYEPKTQLVEKIGEGKNYGALKIPEDFSTVIKALELPYNNGSDFFGIFNVRHTHYLGLNFFKGGEETYPESSGSATHHMAKYTKGKFDYLLVVGKSQLE